MSDTQLVIFSRGRVGKQKTLSYLPSSLIKNNLLFVCPKSEVQDHKQESYAKGLDILGWQDGVHLANKRLGVARKLHKDGVKQFLFMDDDLGLAVWRADSKNFQTTRKVNEEDAGKLVTKNLLLRTDNLFERYAGVGYGCLSMNARMDAIKNHIFAIENKKMCCIFGYRTKEFLEVVDRPQFKDIWGIDTTWNLEMMVRGHNIVTDHHLAWTTNFAIDNGGASSYRTKPAVAHSFLRMMLLHPGLISRGKEGVHVHSFLRISWKDVKNFGNKALSAKGAKLFFEELEHQQTTEKEFLKALPTEAVRFYDKRIQKLRSLL